MENTRSSVAFGTAIVGYDLLSGNPDARQSKARTIVGLALGGGSAVGDNGIELWIEDKKIGTYFNTTTATAFNKQQDLIELNTYVPANALIRCMVIDAAPANTMTVQIEFGRPSYTGSRRFTRRTGSSVTRRTGVRRNSPRSGMY